MTSIVGAGLFMGCCFVSGPCWCKLLINVVLRDLIHLISVTSFVGNYQNNSSSHRQHTQLFKLDEYNFLTLLCPSTCNIVLSTTQGIISFWDSFFYGGTLEQPKPFKFLLLKVTSSFQNLFITILKIVSVICSITAKQFLFVRTHALTIKRAGAVSEKGSNTRHQQ